MFRKTQAQDIVIKLYISIQECGERFSSSELQFRKEVVRKRSKSLDNASL